MAFIHCPVKTVTLRIHVTVIYGIPPKKEKNVASRICKKSVPSNSHSTTSFLSPRPPPLPLFIFYQNQSFFLLIKDALVFIILLESAHPQLCLFYPPSLTPRFHSRRTNIPW